MKEVTAHEGRGGPSAHVLVSTTTRLLIENRGDYRQPMGHCGVRTGRLGLLHSALAFLLLYHEWELRLGAITPPLHCSAWCKDTCGPLPAITRECDVAARLVGVDAARWWHAQGWAARLVGRGAAIPLNLRLKASRLPSKKKQCVGPAISSHST